MSTRMIRNGGTLCLEEMELVRQEREPARGGEKERTRVADVWVGSVLAQAEIAFAQAVAKR